MLREMQCEINEGRLFEDKLCTDFYHDNHSLYFSSANDLDCRFMAILSWGTPPGSSIMRTLWRNPSEMLKNCEKRKDTVGPYPDGVEILLKGDSKKESSKSRGC